MSRSRSPPRLLSGSRRYRSRYAVIDYKLPLAPRIPLKQVTNMNNFYIFRSYSPVPRRRGDYSVSPRRRVEHPRSPRDHPPERDGDHIRRSYSPGYDDAADQNHHTGNGYLE